jgi:hypothetical protein
LRYVFVQLWKMNICSTDHYNKLRPLKVVFHSVLFQPKRQFIIEEQFNVSHFCCIKLFLLSKVKSTFIYNLTSWRQAICTKTDSYRRVDRLFYKGILRLGRGGGWYFEPPKKLWSWQIYRRLSIFLTECSGLRKKP